MTIKGIPMLNAHASMPRSPIHLVIMLAALATGSKTGPAPDIHFTSLAHELHALSWNTNHSFALAVLSVWRAGSKHSKVVNHRILCIFLKQTLGVRDL